MSPADKKHSKSLREVPFALHHSGPSGFEDLRGIVLGSVTGQLFRLSLPIILLRRC